MNRSPLPRDELRRSLTRLHAQLAATPRIDTASQQLLRELLEDIERLLGSSGGAEQVAHSSVPEAASALQKLEALAVEFEARHPALAGSLRQFIDLLGRAGL